ncbi:MAG: Ppx/GppA phosphatase family protein [Brevibacterium aurantiacum]|uniref:Exopolyphosphatase n=1 Tax=Brevibacterium aurantiacum TaxID=273384 RepID=A0A1D7W106_BREAU|nr:MULTISPECIES: Ppx/GppA phosphatase family protein [Brevibacterium]MDN5592384.1 Ppx/GppA family phosphatase [Brevibacterium sp.]AOP52749.1 Exopolyphosphatase [Brevibacterium aurantiacum]AZL05058.1 Ppx/GppA family phosphatase [Brevibacterium aurantiacum]AZL08647.1 Ppx/GppA family phosphatase [Brevibacterium aurantiacum]AZL12257.1 Ppx/GppA family phosphatase [Brevibacterium aurantiacum]
MRLAVLDIGSNSVHLLVVDAHVGAPPLPATSHKEVLRLAEYLGDDGMIDAAGQERLHNFIAEAVEIAEDQGSEQILAFATSAVRDAPNGAELIDSINAQLGVTLNVMSGKDEARVTFLAVRRWFGWSAGKILLLDIGGGSLEIAAGQDEYPEAAVSVPLGAGRTYSDFIPDPLPSAEDIHSLQKYARSQIGRIAGKINRVGTADQVVGSSKTFRSLARIAGAAPSGDGIYAPRKLFRRDLAGIIETLSSRTPEERATLPGVSQARAGQVLAGAIVADAAFAIFDVNVMSISPWALREGIIMRKLDLLDSAETSSAMRVELV